MADVYHNLACLFESIYEFSEDWRQVHQYLRNNRQFGASFSTLPGQCFPPSELWKAVSSVERPDSSELKQGS